MLFVQGEIFICKHSLRCDRKVQSSGFKFSIERGNEGATTDLTASRVGVGPRGNDRTYCTTPLNAYNATPRPALYMYT